MVCFKKNILKLPIPTECNMETSILHKKRGRQRTIPGRLIALESEPVKETSTGSISTNLEKEGNFSDNRILLDEFRIVVV